VQLGLGCSNAGGVVIELAMNRSGKGMEAGLRSGNGVLTRATLRGGGCVCRQGRGEEGLIDNCPDLRFRTGLKIEGFFWDWEGFGLVKVWCLYYYYYQLWPFSSA